HRERVLADPAAWPVSFGVIPSERPIRLRLRLYPARRFGRASLSAFAVDRVLDLSPPTDRVASMHVLLSGDCLGMPADPLTAASCLAPGSATAAAETAEASLVSTWSDAREMPCKSTPRANSGL